MSSVLVAIAFFGMLYLFSEVIWFIIWVLEGSLKHPFWTIYFFKNFGERIKELKENREYEKELKELKKKDGAVEIVKVDANKFYARKVVLKHQPRPTFNDYRKSSYYVEYLYFGRYRNGYEGHGWFNNKKDISYYQTELEVQEAVASVEKKKEDEPKEKVVGTIKF